MNSTEWQTLGDFIAHCSKRGLLEVEDSEEGPYITYIDRSPEAIQKANELERREKLVIYFIIRN